MSDDQTFKTDIIYNSNYRMQEGLEEIAGHYAGILAIMQKDTSEDRLMVKHHTKKILSTISELRKDKSKHHGSQTDSLL